MPTRPAPHELYREALPLVVEAMKENGHVGQAFRVLYLNDDRVDTNPDVFTADQMVSGRLGDTGFINGVIWHPDIPVLRGREAGLVLVEINLNFGNGIVIRNDFAETLLSAVGLAEAGFRLPKNVESAGMPAVRNTLASNLDELVDIVVERAMTGQR